MEVRTGVDHRGTLLALAALGVGLVVWLWPIGLGGRMPVGGDVTQFSIGLMAVLHESLRSGRLPLWNDLWGYGFPGLAESQMGVFYPPHLLLYGLLPTEWAYTASLVLHVAWGALGVFWAGRRLGITPAGSALGAFAWSASGFFVIHLPHQWGYTVGSWMPWAWGLAWQVVRGEGTRRTPFLLATALTLQILPGHFQLAFETQVGIAILGLWTLAERGRGGVRDVLTTALATASAFPLAALQLWPTLRLARLAGARHDFEYLSGFAATPLHLVSYVAPGLFHRSPLWRPLVWDPFRTSPEEYLGYVGLVPLFLALGAIGRGCRRDPGTRALAVLALATLILSLGPHVPGFATWSQWPGFSFFRAPARWSLATALALALLAGKGLDAWPSWPRPGRALARFALAAALLPALAVAGVELALASKRPPGWPGIARGFDKALRLLPWKDDPGLDALVTLAHTPQDDLRVYAALARQGLPATGLVFSRERSSIYRRGLGETGVVLVAMLLLSPLAARRRVAVVGLVALSALDLWAVGRQRAVDCGPIRPLTEQSPVLAHLAALPRGTRSLDSLRNLPMAAGAAPVEAYRTLNIPAVESLTRLAHARLDEPGVVAALRATGTGVRLLDPFEPSARRRVLGWSERETIHDPVLASWLFGADWVARQGARVSSFRVWSPDDPPARAWLVPLTADGPWAILNSWNGEPRAALGVFERAAPLAVRSTCPERLDVEVHADGPAIVVVTQLADPQWRGRWIGPSGERPAAITPALRRPGQGGWQAIAVPGPGAWTLRLDYEARDVRQGLMLSAVAWWAGIVLYLRVGAQVEHSSERDDMTDVAIVGASGYAARELIRILLNHPGARIAVATSRQDESPRLDALHPSLTGRIDLVCEPFDAGRIAERAGVAFLGLPHTASLDAVPALRARGVRVIDLSADYRLTDPQVYADWYGHTHTDPDGLREAVYGLPELYRARIPGANLIANPGCYTSTSILALAPLIADDAIERTGIIVDAKSGVSGAGRSPKLTTHFPECNESLSAYSVGNHRHTPEIDQVLTDVGKVRGGPVEVIFTPHLIPMDRGILATIYAVPKGPAVEHDLIERYRSYYTDSPFVRVVTHLPATKDTAFTNFCDITVRVVRGRILILACLDNLVKGAAGVAVQNFNLMYGHSETTALF